MKKPSDFPDNQKILREKLIGLGENSFHKSYYPELQQRLDELERFRSLLDHSNDAIFLIILPSWQFSDVNQSACHQLGYSREELLAMTFFDIVCSSSLDSIIGLSAECQHSKICRRLLSVLIKKKNGQELPVEMTLCIDQFVNDLYAVAVARDISERKHAEEKIKHLAYHDPLTGLPNRTLFKDRLNLALANVHRNQEMLAVMFLDLDRFKIINDTLGHDVGDRVLRGVSRRLSTLINESDTLSRMGGDEFVLLLPRLSQVDDVVKLSMKILETLNPTFYFEGIELHISTSIGIAIYPNDGNDSKTLLKNADSAMYKAKEQGRNTYQFYTPSMNATASARLEMENNLRLALKRKEFVVFYQPKVDIETRKIVGMECLLRWQHPYLGLVSPMDFIPLAEETGLIVPIGEWVMREACTQNKEWQDKGFSPLRVAVNLSARQFHHQNLVDTVAKILDESNLDPRWLELEITESIAMKKEAYTFTMLRNLKSMGISISLDDFGTGYSSLSYLNRFPIDTIKIDKTFISQISAASDSKPIIIAAIAMAQSLNLKVIAEGVETLEQLTFLKENGCNEIQGYLFSKPLPGQDFEKLMLRDSMLLQKV